MLHWLTRDLSSQWFDVLGRCSASSHQSYPPFSAFKRRLDKSCFRNVACQHADRLPAERYRDDTDFAQRQCGDTNHDVLAQRRLPANGELRLSSDGPIAARPRSESSVQEEFL